MPVPNIDLSETLFPQSFLMSHLIASSSTFQEVMEVDTALQAVDRCHYPAANPEFEGHKLPWAIISDETEFNWRREGVSHFADEGSINVAFDLLIPTEYQTEKQKHDWYSFHVGKILAEIHDTVISGVDGPIPGQTHLNVIGFRRMEGPYEVDVDEYEVYNPDSSQERKACWHSRWEVMYR